MASSPESFELNSRYTERLDDMVRICRIMFPSLDWDREECLLTAIRKWHRELQDLELKE